MGNNRDFHLVLHNRAATLDRRNGEAQSEDLPSPVWLVRTGSVLSAEPGSGCIGRASALALRCDVETLARVRRWVFSALEACYESDDSGTHELMLEEDESWRLEFRIFEDADDSGARTECSPTGSRFDGQGLLSVFLLSGPGMEAMRKERTEGVRIARRAPGGVGLVAERHESQGPHDVFNVHLRGARPDSGKYDPVKREKAQASIEHDLNTVVELLPAVVLCELGLLLSNGEERHAWLRLFLRWRPEQALGVLEEGVSLTLANGQEYELSPDELLPICERSDLQPLFVKSGSWFPARNDIGVLLEDEKSRMDRLRTRAFRLLARIG